MSLTRHQICGHGDAQLSVHEGGPKGAQSVILIHGWSQCHLSWERQFTLTDRLHLIAPDLRGHGQSDKPRDPSAYDNSAPWAGDIAAIIEHFDLINPILVGWSMGGWVVMDHLRINGDANLGGVMLVGSNIIPGQPMPPAAEATRARPEVKADGMFTGTLAQDLAATTAFVQACFHQQPAPDDLARMVGFNMLCPQHARACRKRREDYRPVAANTNVPAHVTWGAHEGIAPPPLSQIAAQAFANATTHAFANSGHAPFYEEPEAFNAALLAFVESCAA